MTLPRTPSFRLEGRRALVAGASSGIGAAAAVALAEAGADVTLAARNLDRLKDMVAEFRANGWQAQALRLDVADTVMIGDTTYDVMTGRNAGTGTIGVTWGVHPEDELRGAGAHHVADEFHELTDLIDTLIEQGRAG